MLSFQIIFQMSSYSFKDSVFIGGNKTSFILHQAVKWLYVFLNSSEWVQGAGNIGTFFQGAGNISTLAPYGKHHTHFIFSDLSWMADITHYSKNPIFTEKSINNHALACFIYKMKMKTVRLHLLWYYSGKPFPKRQSFFPVLVCQ